MSLLEKLSSDEKNMLIDYIESYGFSGGSEGSVKASFDYLFRFWDTNKSEYLANMFGGELILSKEISYKRDIEDLIDDLNCRLYKDSSSDTPEARFINKFYFYKNEAFYGNYTLKDAWDRLCSSEVLARNVYDGETVSVPTPDGKEIKIAYGCRATKAIGKLAKAFGIDEGFEEFRIAHSMVLNQKELKGNLCLSIHPMDYFTMSDNNCGWSSCMSWYENGCYRMGTVEMMNSPMVIVAYLTAKDEMSVPGGFKWNSKKWRELYIVNKDIITNVKAYPYKNENLTKSVIAWLKELAENAGIAKYDKVPFSWCYGYQNDSPRLASTGIRLEPETCSMYNDFESDAGQWSYLREDLPHNDKYYICYSGETECVCCGEVNHYFDCEGCLVCDECEEIIYCDDCGERIYEGDDSYIVDGHTICSNCYDCHTVESILTQDLHMRYNCINIGLSYDEDAPYEGRSVRYDHGWRDRGIRKAEQGDNGKTVIRGLDLWIYDDEIDEAAKRYSKKGEFERLSRRYNSDIFAIRMSDVTEELALDMGFDTLKDFLEEIKGMTEEEVY